MSIKIGDKIRYVATSEDGEVVAVSQAAAQVRLKLTGLRGARVGLVTALLDSDPEDAEIATVVRAAVNEMKAAGADVVEITIAPAPCEGPRHSKTYWEFFLHG